MSDDIADRLETVETRLETLSNVAVENDAEIEDVQREVAGLREDYDDRISALKLALQGFDALGGVAVLLEKHANPVADRGRPARHRLADPEVTQPATVSKTPHRLMDAIATSIEAPAMASPAASPAGSPTSTIPA
jgi:C4-dicarboxylate-specific signal transduction histidine kinase